VEAPVSGPLAVFDVLLAAAILGAAAVLLTTRDLFRSIVLFIVFGVLVAILWARLGAVDVALAEAALGAGITGALLLRAAPAGAQDVEQPRSLPVRVGCAALCVAVFAALARALLAAPPRHTGMAPEVAAELAGSGVSAPVTAVLLSFRAYDTLLEIAVLLLAVIAAWAQRLPRQDPDLPAAALLVGVVRLVVPVMVLAGGYLLWRGSHAPGGAFQGGAVLAGAGVLLALAGFRAPPRWRETRARLALAAGLGGFLAVGLGAALGRGFLAYRGATAGYLIVTIEVAATIGIAAALIALIVGRDPAAPEDGAP
jgi:multisubunit Na+/H+ antiporter MnhB subunit